MSQENVEAFKRGLDAFNRGDVEAVLKELDTDVEWHPVLQMVMLGEEERVYRGHEGVREAFRHWDEIFAEIHIELAEIRDLGERIVAMGCIHARGQESGAEVDSPGAWVAELKDGKALCVSEYLDPEEALEAVGLRE
jgi:ketosteroid isomerase-like protein